MKETLKPGLESEFTFTVTDGKTVPALYPESPEFQAMPKVFATGFMVGFIEWACIKLVNPHLDWPEEQTVGTQIDVSHTAATPPGMNVTAHVKLVTVEGRRLVFEVEARDEGRADRQGHPRAVRDRQEALRRENEQEERHLMQKENKGLVFVSLATLYIAWSSTYFAIRVALEAFPPFFIAGFRYMLVGGGIFLYLKAKGTPWPVAAGMGRSNGHRRLPAPGRHGLHCVRRALGRDQGMAALVLSTSPLLTVLFAMLWKHRPARNEWLGIFLGVVGIILLNLEGDLRTHPLGAVCLILASASWSFGSVLSLHVPMPRGMMASATQMFVGRADGARRRAFRPGERVPAHPPGQATVRWSTWRLRLAARDTRPIPICSRTSGRLLQRAMRT